jgi:hypothetical protein
VESPFPPGHLVEYQASTLLVWTLERQQALQLERAQGPARQSVTGREMLQHHKLQHAVEEVAEVRQQKPHVLRLPGGGGGKVGGGTRGVSMDGDSVAGSFDVVELLASVIPRIDNQRGRPRNRKFSRKWF